MNKKDVYVFCYYMARDNIKLEIDMLSELFSVLNIKLDMEKINILYTLLEKMRNETEKSFKCVDCIEHEEDCKYFKNNGSPCPFWRAA